MPYRCPNCREPLDATGACANGHRYVEEGGVLRLLSDDFARQLVPFSAALKQYRAGLGRRILDPAAYEALPHGTAVERDREWQQRQYDLDVVRQLLEGRSGLRVLDVGAYNGWLSHRLAEQGHAVTGSIRLPIRSMGWEREVSTGPPGARFRWTCAICRCSTNCSTW